MAVRELVEYVLNLGGDLAEEAEKARTEVNSLTDAATLGVRAASGLAAGALAAGAAYAKLANDVFGVVDQVGDLAAAAGLSTDTVNGLRLAARATSGELEELVPQKLSAMIVEAAEGGKNATAAFERLGISVRGANGEIGSADDIFRSALERILAIEDPTIRAAAALDVFGKQGKALLGTFEDIDAFDHFVAGAREFGIDTGPAAAAAAADWYNSMNTLATAFEHVQQTLLDNIGGVTKWVDAFSLGLVYITDVVSGFGTVLLDVRDKVLANAKEIFEGIQDAIAGRPIEINVTTREDLAELAAAGIEMVLSNARANAEEFWEGFIRDAPVAPGAGGGTGSGRPSGVLGDPTATALDITGGARRFGVQFVDDADVAGLNRGSGPSVRELTGWEDKAEAALYVAEQSGLRLADVFDAIADAGGAVGGAIGKGAVGAAGAIGALQGGLEGVGGALGMAVAGPVGAAVGSAVGTVMSDLDEVPDLLEDLGTDIVGFAESLPEVLPEIVTALLTALPQALQEAGIAIVEMILDPEFWLDIFKALGEALLESVKRLLGISGENREKFEETYSNVMLGSLPDGRARDMFQDLAAAEGEKRIFGIKVPFFDDGTDNVSKTGLAVVHAGERIVPAHENHGGGGGMSVGTFNIFAANGRDMIRQLQEMRGSFGLNETINALGLG